MKTKDIKKITVTNISELKSYETGGVCWSTRGQGEFVVCACGETRTDSGIPCPSCHNDKMVTRLYTVNNSSTDTQVFTVSNSQFEVVNEYLIRCSSKKAFLRESSPFVYEIVFSDEEYLSIHLDAISLEDLFEFIGSKHAYFRSSHGARYFNTIPSSYASSIVTILREASAELKQVRDFFDIMEELGFDFKDGILKASYYRLLLHTPKLKSFLKELKSKGEDIQKIYCDNESYKLFKSLDLAFGSIANCISRLSIPAWLENILNHPVGDSHLWADFLIDYDNLLTNDAINSDLKLPYELQKLLEMNLQEKVIGFNEFASLYKVLISQKNYVAANKFLRKYLVKYKNNTTVQLESIINNIAVLNGGIDTDYSYQILSGLHLKLFSIDKLKRSTKDIDTFVASFDSGPLDAIMECANAPRKIK